MITQIADYLTVHYLRVIAGLILMFVWLAWMYHRGEKKNKQTRQIVEDTLQKLRYELYSINAQIYPKMKFDEKRDDSNLCLPCGLGIGLRIHDIMIVFKYEYNGYSEPDGKICNVIVVSGGNRSSSEYTMAAVEDAKQDFMTRIKELI